MSLHSRKSFRRLSGLFLAATALAGVTNLGGCSSTSNGSSPGSGSDGGSDAAVLTDDQYRAQVVQAMHDALLTDINGQLAAAQAIQSAAPTSLAGWSDSSQLDAMKNAWLQGRNSYEHSEGAIAPLFPDIDRSIDARYDDFLASSPGGDADLFDDQDVTGMHGIERILYVAQTPGNVVTFESTLPGYKAAALPATEQEATEFKTKLCAKLVTDVTELQTQWQPASINIAIAFQGLVALMNEQREKVNKAASSEEESRYSQRTMADLRDNLDGTKTVYALFQPWLLSKKSDDPTKDGVTIDGKIQAGFQRLNDAYSQVQGDAIPAVPPTWSSEQPSASDLQTPFGQLYSHVHDAVDPNTDGSIVFEMNAVASLLGFPIFTQ